MLRFLVGVLTGVIFAAIIAVIAVFAISLSFGRGKEKPTAVSENSTLVLRLQGDVPERPPVEYNIPFFPQKNSLTVENVWSLLHHAATDSRIKALVIEPADPQIGWAKLQELHADITAFRKSGKPVYAYLKSPGTRDYYLATAATRIFLAPEDLLNLKGIRFELMYFRHTFDKLGVQMDVEHAGKYKDYGDMFIRSSMSPETREVYSSVLEGLFSNLVQTIAEGRHRSPEDVRALIDDGPFTSPQAVAKGLVDEVRFEDEMYGALKITLKSGDIQKVSARDYTKASDESSAKQRIAFVTGEGDITRGDPESTSDASGIQSEHFNKTLHAIESDATIKGVIVRINSPGGESTASDELWRAMNQLSRKKPMVISMSDDAASGGYYMVMTGDPVIAYPTTLTGSIGVVFAKPNLHGLYDKLGIDKEILSKGRFARIDSDYDSLSPEGRAKLREGIDEEYRSFVTKVAEARKRKFDDIEPLSQGRVWLGEQAKQNGLIDELGGLDKAVELIRQRAKIPVTDQVSLIQYPPKRTLFELLTASQSQENAVEARIAATPILKDLHLQTWMRGGMLRLMPFTPSFR